MPEVDLTAPARQVTALVTSVPDDALDGPTPCPAMTVATLLEHIRGLSIAFTDAATKATPPPREGDPAGPPEPSAENLPADWRDAIPSGLAAVAGAWQLPEAWEGETTAGGVTLPAEVMGLVAFNELVIHGWDLAVATNQAYQPDEATLQVSYDFLLPTVDDPASRGDIYGPVVPVPDDAPLLDRVIGLAGRNPAWQPH
jgi:uncharacterized protein (TIGR03086 family)